MTATEVRTKVYPIPAAADGALGEYTSEEELALLDDFAAYEYLAKYDQAVKTNDRELFDLLVADQAIYVAERFGRGARLSKTEFMTTFGDAKPTGVHVTHHTHDNVRLRAFGGNTVVQIGNSTSLLTYKGQISRGPRLFAVTYMKLDGRWQCVVHTTMEYSGWL
jgi:hypothetical protein